MVIQYGKGLNPETWMKHRSGLDRIRIGLITYNMPHRKTFDIACLLKMKFDNITLLLTDFEERPERHPLIQHRPENNGIQPGKIASAFGFEIQPFNKKDVKTFDVLIIGGCNLIPDIRALNSHPGYLPYVRGLDALKWAIYYSLPIGITVHETTDEADKGPILLRKIVPLYFEDTFHSFAYRVYKYEVELLVEAILDPEFIEEEDERTGFEEIIHKRMPPYKERIMLSKFEQIRSASRSIYDT